MHNKTEIISVRNNPEYAGKAIEYFQKHWAGENNKMVYADCIKSCIGSPSPLPQWYLLYSNDLIIGCAGLITNDFISRMDLWPWLCALYIDENFRGNGFGSLLIEKIKTDAKKSGFSSLYLCTDHTGYYERCGFEKLATGYHPWGESSTIYMAALL